MKPEDISLALSYDDVLLKPQYSEVMSRADVNLKTKLTKNIYLNIPIVSANMDTVTEARMAIEMARAGGIGIIHRFMTIEEQVKQIEKVKRASNIVIYNPYTLSCDQTLKDALEARERYEVSSFLIVDDRNKLVGILTNRDMEGENLEAKIAKLMTPKSKLRVGKGGISAKKAKALMQKYPKVEKLPLVDDDGKLWGLITMKDIRNRAQFPYASKDKSGRLLVGAAIGVKEYQVERAKALVEAGADVIVIDVAHGHSSYVLETIAEVRKEIGDVELIAGNVATKEGVKDLAEARVDGIKVGIGPGSMCSTRVNAGCGVPQFTAVMECSMAAKEYGIPCIADGGINHPGDIAKAIGAGAYTVMIGKLLAGTEESPGLAIIKDGKKVKIYRGMAGLGAAMGRAEREHKDNKENLKSFAPEGEEGIVPYSGPLSDVLKQLLGGLRSGMSYSGSCTIEEMHEKSKFVRQTSAGYRESHPRKQDL